MGGMGGGSESPSRDGSGMGGLALPYGMFVCIDSINSRSSNKDRY